jgi:aerobic carbon-monoxide dehydrogenase large subunit
MTSSSARPEAEAQPQATVELSSMHVAPGQVIGRRIQRLEDPRLLTGQAPFVADINLPGMLHAAIVRSPAPHGYLRAIDATEALSSPGVHAVLTAQDLGELGVGEMPVHWLRPGQRNVSNPILATDKVYYVGQPVAVVVAEDPYAAEDAAELVSLDIDPLPAMVNAEEALQPGATILHEEWETNLLAEHVASGGDVDRQFEDAEVVIAERFQIQRQAGMPIETRGVAATYDPLTGELTAWISTQMPHLVKTDICQVCRWPGHKVRVIAPAVGGGFGVKEPPYPEEIVVCLLARQLARPVKWVEDRREHFLASVHARETTWDMELAADRSGRILGLRGRVIYDVGGHASTQGIGVPIVGTGMMLGPYDVQHMRVHILGAVTNKVPAGAYRGFGRPQATFVMERLVDKLAARLGLDRAEVRRRNFIVPRAQPYRNALGHVYDGGDYGHTLDRALQRIGYEGFATRQAEARAQGRLLGIGFVTFVMEAGLGPSKLIVQGGHMTGTYETVLIRMDPSGKAVVFCGSASQGQGHETTLAQVCADRLGLDPERDVVVVLGDTATTPYSPASAIGSRVGMVGGAATLLAANRIREKLVRLTAHLLEANEADIEIAEGLAYVQGSKDRALTIQEVATAACLGCDLPDGMLPGVEVSETFDPPVSTFPYATHAATVEIDPHTGGLTILRYVVVQDCGTMINPAVVEGQIAGGVAQGIGGALLEQLVYNRDGQPLTTSFMDYLLPTAVEIPDIEIEHLETPAPEIPGGMKGLGEAGTVAPAAVLGNAVADALSPFSARVTTLPLDPDRLWRSINRREDGAS